MSKPKVRSRYRRLLVGVLAGLGATFACLAAAAPRREVFAVAALSIWWWLMAVYLAASR